MKKKIIQIIKFYQKYISPDHSDYARKNNHVPYCKHYPTCSMYTIEAIEKKGVVIGVLKGFWRILRCMPWSKGGYDPVDSNQDNKK